MSPNLLGLHNEKEIREVAIKIYLRLPFYKRWSYLKWYRSNNWDVNGIFTKCVEEAKFLLGQDIN